MTMTRLLTITLLLTALSACGTGPKQDATSNVIRDEMARATSQRKAAAPPPAVTQAMLPPLRSGRAEAPPREPRFDLAVNDAPAAQVFNAIVDGTRYSMLVHPEVAGSVSLNVKNVTVAETLEALRELYGYEYRFQGNRIYIQPVALQTRIFKINYLMMQRQGRTDTRVTSGSIINAGNSSGSSGTSGGGSASGGSEGVTGGGSTLSSSSSSDFWAELEQAVKSIVGGEPGRSVIVSPLSGVLLVKAMPSELREVSNYLKASQVAIERQVMLEAKIIEVVLREGFESGVNWAGFTDARNHRWSSGANAGQFKTPAPGLGVNEAGGIATPYNETAGAYEANSLGNILNAPGSLTGGRLSASPLAGVLGLAFQTNDFSALIKFLKTQGNVQVLSSPRIATINNQKAVLKVGTDEMYITNISSSTTTSGTSTTSAPTITVQPFFSGIALDVTPQIDETDNIILHVRPSVSVVNEKNKIVNMGSLGTFTLPLASSNINETDSIVRVQDGNIVAIGGLMEQVQEDDSGKVPGAGDLPVVGELFKQGRKGLQKRELVVLIKPTIIRSDADWQADLEATQRRLDGMRMKPAAKP